MKRLVLAILLVATLTACATQQRWRWEKPNGAGTDTERQKDYSQCDYEATVATASLGTSGYRTMLGSSLERTLRQVELIQMCMQNKGWYKQGY